MNDTDVTTKSQASAVVEAAAASQAAQAQDDFPIGMVANPIRTRI